MVECSQSPLWGSRQREHEVEVESEKAWRQEHRTATYCQSILILIAIGVSHRFNSGCVTSKY